MSNRTHINNQNDMVSRAGYNPHDGYCVAVSIALALCDADVDEAVEMLPLVVEELTRSGRFQDGIGYGLMDCHLEAVGIESEFRGEDLDYSKTGYYDHDGWNQQYRIRQGYPTLAQWVRRNPDVRKAVIRGTGHAGFLVRKDDGTVVVYNMNPRKRIDHAAVIEKDPT